MSTAYRCPKCGSEGPFLSHVTDYVRIDAQDIVTVVECGGFDACEEMECEACEHTGLVDTFMDAAEARNAQGGGVK